jgi:hypothetical protein
MSDQYVAYQRLLYAVLMAVAHDHSTFPNDPESEGAVAFDDMELALKDAVEDAARNWIAVLDEE